ncbi:diacylglycerol/lipid kinase family protein [Polyangium sorediatum]|uniref:Diacylglycerol kinase family lipid kinase n=1 Tax=Polyangium sorediatum TaxID=889274 RepID=A0ABT6NV13_9BACT|nr:diacylglycerol kinase family protein [Polyangium sorediatum]MDI1431960.1 diacylglycerol kinase family lipid kinase [Polyangium sorediatum]
MKPLLIVNPQSAGGKTGALFEKMRGPIERHLGHVDVVFTERSRHAVDIARDAASEGRGMVISVGGDGSIHEVVCGLMEARDAGKKLPKFGIIGAGTGGDYRRTLGFENRLDRYCEAIAEGKTRAVDIGRFSYATHTGERKSSYFVNILSVGMSGLVDQLVAESTRTLGGTMAYFTSSVKGLARSVVGRVKCTIWREDGSREETIETRCFAICNGRYFGSGMQVAPMAHPDDGLFDVVDLGAASRLRFFMVSSRMYTGTHVHSLDVKHYRCERIQLELLNEDVADRFLLDVDGEPLGRLPLEVEMVPGAIEVLVPKQ